MFVGNEKNQKNYLFRRIIQDAVGTFLTLLQQFTGLPLFYDEKNILFFISAHSTTQGSRNVSEKIIFLFQVSINFSNGDFVCAHNSYPYLPALMKKC